MMPEQTTTPTTERRARTGRGAWIIPLAFVAGVIVAELGLSRADLLAVVVAICLLMAAVHEAG